jgi:hypothetical protein
MQVSEDVGLKYGLIHFLEHALQREGPGSVLAEAAEAGLDHGAFGLFVPQGPELDVLSGPRLFEEFAHVGQAFVVESDIWGFLGWH